MDESDIEVVAGENYPIILSILTKFLEQNKTVSSFPNLSENSRRANLWQALFHHLQNKTATFIHAACLATIRTLSRDKTDLENLVSAKWINILTERAGLHELISLEDETMQPVDMSNKDIQIEAQKCLCNIVFQSEVARSLCATTGIANGLIARLRIYKELPYKNEIMLYDMKLLFILTALRPDVKNMVKNDLHGMDYLTSCLDEILLEAANNEALKNSGLVEGDLRFYLDDAQQEVVLEILKAQFNLVPRPASDEILNDSDEAMFLKLMPILSNLLVATCTTEDRKITLQTQVANLLTSVPVSHYPALTPLVAADENVEHQFDGYNMKSLHVLLQYLHNRLTNTQSTAGQNEKLSPILTVMYKSSSSCRHQRRYLRGQVLPPLRDVSAPPERGNTLRNQLCRLLTTPVTQVRDLAAEFLFILCKNNVGRMVKYTGFGNAAGLLAQKGLLGGVQNGQYSSSSDDSDTEEYLAAQSSIDPVVGCSRPPRSNPLEGMSEEQKEYEAMKLVDLFNRLASSSGLVQPARVGPDGRPQPIEHVLELRENPPNRPQS